MKRFVLLACTSVILAFTLNSIKLHAEIPDVDRTLLLQDLKILSSDAMEGRAVETRGNAKARAYIVERFTKSGIQPYTKSYEHRFHFRYREDKTKAQHRGVNIVGIIPGTTSELQIVVTAHYDHLGIRKGKIYNGADDNASGVASLFALGSYFAGHPPAHTILIAALDAEEVDAETGSTKLLEQLDRNKIGMNVNLDMIGRDPNNILYAAGTYHYPFLKPYLKKVAARSRVKLLFGHDVPNQKGVEDWTPESDHHAFHARGIPFIYFGVEDFEHHHEPTDDFENITQEFFVNAVKTVVMALKEFDRHLAEIKKTTDKHR